MPRFIVTTRRASRDSAESALSAIIREGGIKVVNSVDPHVVTVEAPEDRATALAVKLRTTHIVEPEIRRTLE